MADVAALAARDARHEEENEVMEEIHLDNEEQQQEQQKISRPSLLSFVLDFGLRLVAFYMLVVILQDRSQSRSGSNYTSQHNNMASIASWTTKMHQMSSKMVHSWSLHVHRTFRHTFSPPMENPDALMMLEAWMETQDEETADEDPHEECDSIHRDAKHREVCVISM